MTVHPIDHAGLEILPFADCLRLIEPVPEGRVGFLADGEIIILPVNHLMDGPDVIFRTGSGVEAVQRGQQDPRRFRGGPLRHADPFRLVRRHQRVHRRTPGTAFG